VVAGAIAKQMLHQQGMDVMAYVQRVKDVEVPVDYSRLNLALIDSNDVRCPHEETAQRMIALIDETKQNGDSVGGEIICLCKEVPAGLGEPVFDKLHAVMAHAMMSINAVKAFEIGDGYASSYRFGSENNDALSGSDQTNHDGGVQGGISNGKDIVMHIGFKPVSTISKPQHTVDLQGNEVMLEAKGRHDPCVLPRAVPIVEAMAALVLADMLLMRRTNRL
jgi:chorismate synthase